MICYSYNIAHILYMYTAQGILTLFWALILHTLCSPMYRSAVSAHKTLAGYVLVQLLPSWNYYKTQFIQ